MLRKLTPVAFACVFVGTLFNAGSAAAQAGFARITNDGQVSIFGGSNTTTVQAAHVGTGEYDITFVGNFPPTTVNGFVVFQVTTDSQNFDIANAFVYRTDTNHIGMGVVVFRCFDAELDDDNFSVTIYIGTPPRSTASASGSNTVTISTAGTGLEGSK